MIVHGASDSFTEVQTHFTELDFKTRIMNTVKVSGSLLAVAAVGVFIPIVHFILVPTALFLSIILGRINFKKRFYVEETSFKCPDCKKDIQLKGSFPEKSLRVYCYGCRTQLRIDG